MISIVILSHNSEKTIETTLDSVKWCKDILIVDDNSEDGTVLIAKKRNVRYVSHLLHDDFSAQRNYGLGLVTGPWVLFLDSDEVISSELQTEIFARCGNERGVVGYKFYRTDIVFGKKLRYGESSHVLLTRLAKKDRACWSDPVHEVWTVKGNVRVMTHPILHTPYDNVAQFISKINTYSTLRAKFLFNNNVHVSAWQIICFPFAKFIKNYIAYQGFRDGTEGIIHALIMSFHSFLTRSKLWQLWDTHLRKS